MNMLGILDEMLGPEVPLAGNLPNSLIFMSIIF